MRFVAVVFIYTGTFLCSLPACSSDVTCNITLDNSVYAFPSHIISDLTSTSDAYFFLVKVIIQLDEERLTCRENRRNSLAVGFDKQMLENFTTKVSTEPEGNPFDLILTVDPKRIFDQVEAKIGVAEFYFYSIFEGGCSNQYSRTCKVKTIFLLDNPPTVVFKSALNVLPRKWINVSSDLNGTSSPSQMVEVEMDNIDNNVEVYIEVNDNDYFVDNTEKFEYCAISEPNITLSSAATFHSFLTNSSNNYTLYNQPLATDDKNNWWKKNSFRINETHIIVRFDFAASALSSAINGLLSLFNNSGNLSLERSFEAVLNLTLDVTATSGRKNPQKSFAKFILLLRLKGKMSSGLATLSQSDYSDITTVNNTAPSSKAAVICTIFAVLLVVIVLFLFYKFRARILRSCTSRPVPDDSSTTAGAHETCGCFSITASSDRKRNDTGLDNRHGALVAEVSAEVTTSLIDKQNCEAKQSELKSSASAT